MPRESCCIPKTWVVHWYLYVCWYHCPWQSRAIANGYIASMFLQQINCSYWTHHFLDYCVWDWSLYFGFWIMPNSYLVFVNSRYSILWSLVVILLFASLAVLESFLWYDQYYCLYHHQLNFSSNTNLRVVLNQVYFFSFLLLAQLNSWFYQAFELIPEGNMDFLD